MFILQFYAICVTLKLTMTSVLIVGEKSSEDLVLSSYFSDHMVLQRGPKRRALIWGLLGLKGNQTIIVNLTSFNGDTYMVYKKVVSERGLLFVLLLIVVFILMQKSCILLTN